MSEDNNQQSNANQAEENQPSGQPSTEAVVDTHATPTPLVETVDKFPRLKPFLDKSMWILILLGIVVLGIVDRTVLLTLLQWMSFGLVLGGLTILISRVTFPQIRLTSLLKEATEGNNGAAMIAAALVIYCALVFIGLVMWAK